jgi:acetyl-CoA carboxylase biotin carboxylase subunit
MLRRVLIANRGEIAVRVIRACREMGIESVAVYSDADARAMHVSLADQSVRIGPASPSASYLAIDALIAAAQRTGADSIHPGYGFLSENETFASACEAAGITFIGPPAAAIARMGSKIAARRLAQAAGAPVVPGETPHEQTDERIAAAARRVGFPVLLKPSAGGGGIGMKIVRHDHGLAGAITQARREAESAFGDGTLYVERLIDKPRHVEFQIFADAHGNVIHLFERECSIQRRHQKVIEETPSTALTPALRRRMGAAAVAIARHAGYRNAGTIEFLVDASTTAAAGGMDNAAFYFLEMNTRLQVEHPVTEQVTGVDLVRAQILVAGGAPLPWAERELTQRGHAIELRIYAEDPARDHLPQAGSLLLYREPTLPGVRIDAGVSQGDEVSVHYDPLLAKLIASGETREAARQRALAALRDYPILGIRTNIPLLQAVLEHPRFIAGDIDTHFLDTEWPHMHAAGTAEPPPEVLAIARAAAGSALASPGAPDPLASDPWMSLRGVRV